MIKAFVNPSTNPQLIYVVDIRNKIDLRSFSPIRKSLGRIMHARAEIVEPQQLLDKINLTERRVVLTGLCLGAISSALGLLLRLNSTSGTGPTDIYVQTALPVLIVAASILAWGLWRRPQLLSPAKLFLVLVPAVHIYVSLSLMLFSSEKSIQVMEQFVNVSFWIPMMMVAGFALLRLRWAIVFSVIYILVGAIIAAVYVVWATQNHSGYKDTETSSYLIAGIILQFSVAQPMYLTFLILIARFRKTMHLSLDAVSKNRNLANTDSLTGLVNRRALDLILEKSIAEVSRGRQSIALVMVDVDRFKQVNDVHGHEIGDRVLQHVAQTLSNGVRSMDVVGRWGGEEFLLILAGCSLDHAHSVAESARADLASVEIEPVGMITASFGITTIMAGDSAANAVSRADNAMYTAKNQGRNRVSAFS